MNTKRLSFDDPWATLPPNPVSTQANKMVELARWTPPKKSAFGVDEDPPLHMKLYRSDGSELPANAKIVIAGQAPDDPLPIPLTPKMEYRRWKAVDFKDQFKSDYEANLHIDTAEDLLFEELEAIILYVEDAADSNVDLTKSQFDLPGWELTMNEVEAIGLAGSDFEAGDYMGPEGPYGLIEGEEDYEEYYEE